MESLLACLKVEDLVLAVLDFVLTDIGMAGMWLARLAKVGPTKDFARLLRHYGRRLSEEDQETLFYTAAFNYQYEIVQIILDQCYRLSKNSLLANEWQDKSLIKLKIEQNVPINIPSCQPMDIGTLQWLYQALDRSQPLTVGNRLKFESWYVEKAHSYLTIQFIPFVTKDTAWTHILYQLDGRGSDPRIVQVDKRGTRQRTTSQLLTGNSPTLSTRYLAAMFDIPLILCKRHRWTSLENIIPCEACAEEKAILAGTDHCSYHDCVRLAVKDTLCQECNYRACSETFVFLGGPSRSMSQLLDEKAMSQLRDHCPKAAAFIQRSNKWPSGMSVSERTAALEKIAEDYNASSEALSEVAEKSDKLKVKVDKDIKGDERDDRLRAKNETPSDDKPSDDKHSV